MPYRTEWEEPELFLEHKGVKVYRAYKDADAGRPLTYWYAIYPDEDTTQDEDDAPLFDIRKCPSYDAKLPARTNLVNAIEQGALLPTGPTWAT